MPNGSGPPDKFAFIDTAGKGPDDVANQLSILYAAGFNGPYVTVGEIIYVGGYSTQGQQ